jgi:hypothetical protein
MLKLNNNTKYFFTLNDPTYVVLKLVNIIGIEYATLVNGIRKPGFYEENYDGSNSPAGIYYYKLFVEDPSPNGSETFTFPNDCPDKRFKLIDTKEILII